jgi:putative nucleotidyltransferase with HDIG domain
VIPPIRFLHSLSHALAATSLYGPAHPARIRAVQASYEALRSLQAEDEEPAFSFLGRDVIYGYDALRELRDWEWSLRLAAAGIQRIEIVNDVTPEDFALFLDDVHAHLVAQPSGSDGDATEPHDASPMRQTSIRFGALGLQGASGGGGGMVELPAGEIAFTLQDEADAVRYIHSQVTGQASVPLVEAEAVVRSLSVALHADGRLLIPLLKIKAFDQYTTTHSINVAVLSMALAESLGHSPRDIRAMGVAGLLHDLGKVRVPAEILTKAGSLSPEEREMLERHPADGARIILNSDRRLTLPAAVAFEHHIMINGGGYPHRHFSRDCHYASTVVHVCDVFDALHTERPYRAAWPSAKALHYIERRAGREFDPLVANAFIALMRQHERAVGVVGEASPVMPVGAPSQRRTGSLLSAMAFPPPGATDTDAAAAADDDHAVATAAPPTPASSHSSNGQPTGG